MFLFYYLVASLKPLTIDPEIFVSPADVLVLRGEVRRCWSKKFHNLICYFAAHKNHEYLLNGHSASQLESSERIGATIKSIMKQIFTGAVPSNSLADIMFYLS